MERRLLDGGRELVLNESKIILLNEAGDIVAEALKTPITNKNPVDESWVLRSFTTCFWPKQQTLRKDSVQYKSFQYWCLGSNFNQLASMPSLAMTIKTLEEFYLITDAMESEIITTETEAETGTVAADSSENNETTEENVEAV